MPEVSFNEDIELEEIKNAISKLQNGKAKGPDAIPNEFIKEGGDMLQTCLKLMFNTFLRAGNTPISWCYENVKLLHKGKSKQELTNYRTIALTSNIGKVFTRIIGKR